MFPKAYLTLFYNAFTDKRLSAHYFGLRKMLNLFQIGLVLAALISFIHAGLRNRQDRAGVGVVELDGEGFSRIQSNSADAVIPPRNKGPRTCRARAAIV